jgi:4-hydroxy-tetrahydrodipicolinate synthase
VTPYYNKPTQEGLSQHYQAIAEATPLPIIVYNVPGRTGVNIDPRRSSRLARSRRSSASRKRPATSRRCARSARRARGFLVLSGDDALTLP